MSVERLRLVIVVLSCLLAGCTGRPLSEGERAFAADLLGPRFDVGRARIGKIGTSPEPDEPQEAPVIVAEIEPRAGICDRAAPDTGPRGPPPAFALYDTVKVAREFYREDMMAGWPRQVFVPEALIVAHELVHVWQWQNRGLTGYRPARAAAESVLSRDPYFYTPEAGAGFLEYGFEQQAALVEDYMCYVLYDPENPRRAELTRILSPFFTLDRLDAARLCRFPAIRGRRKSVAAPENPAHPAPERFGEFGT